MPAKSRPPDGAIVLRPGVWVVMGPMSGRDLLALAELPDSADDAKPADMIAVLRIIERRVVDASVPDVLDLPIPDLLRLIGMWQQDTEEAAVPPVSAAG